LEHARELHVALQAIAADTLDAHRSAAQGAGREEVGSRGGVALDLDAARRRIAFAARDRESAPALARDLDAEAAHEPQRELDVGLADEAPLHLDARSLA